MRITNLYNRAEAVPGLIEKGELTGSARSLQMWQEALEAARDSGKTEEKSFWELLFEKRAENHEIAMALSEEAAAARRATVWQTAPETAAQTYAAASTGSLEAGAGASIGAVAEG